MYIIPKRDSNVTLTQQGVRLGRDKHYAPNEIIKR